MALEGFQRFVQHDNKVMLRDSIYKGRSLETC